ncbi:hypothetical protein NHX12_008313 [Muraenolepis orangiensis]|uniref:Secreted protein n=1 Tax=Muraenolepis orangiensis TaxID=630683 RepID=A0A9Q0DMM8_9TELE|nr:hypothetical protein NHX12_008308 [Muraenolepis orangiensis]KAJ3590361.1 hypothetical protein NHX12_008313 [Muraenolepis orangiensis]
MLPTWAPLLFLAMWGRSTSGGPLSFRIGPNPTKPKTVHGGHGQTLAEKPYCSYAAPHAAIANIFISRLPPPPAHGEEHSELGHVRS